MFTIDSQNKSFVQQSNQLLASLTELIGRVFIEKQYFQNHSIPMTTLIYLANDVINLVNQEEENKKTNKDKKEKLSLVKELTIGYKQLTGKALTKDEEAYDNEIHEVDVTQEIFNGIKYATSFSIFKNLYNSVSSAISQNLSEHIPAIIGSTAALTVAPYLLSNAIEKVLSKSNLNPEQKAIIKPWLNTVGRLALAFTPKVEANESGVNYHYPSTEGHTELYKNIRISVSQNGKHLLGDKADVEVLNQNIGFKLRRIQLGENNSVEVIGLNNKNEEIKIDFSFMDKALSYAPDYYSVSKFAVALGTQKILLKNSSPLLPLLMMPSLFTPSVKAQGVGAVGREFLVNTNTAGNQEYPKIAKLNDGGFVSIWASDGQDGSGYGVYGKRFAMNGTELMLPTSGLNTAFGAEFRINTYPTDFQGLPAVSALNDGGFVVVWTSNFQDGSDYGVYGKRFAANGTQLMLPASGLNTALGAEFRINAYTIGSQSFPVISALNDGGFVVVWTSNGQDGSSMGVYGKRFALNGAEVMLPTSGLNTALGAEFRINTYTNSNQANPDVSALNDGGFVVVWESNIQDGSGYGIYGKRFALNGAEVMLPTSGLNTALGAEFRINTYTISNQRYPAVSALNDGGFVVVWMSNNQDGTNESIYGKRFALNGTELMLATSGLNTAAGNEFRINTYTTGIQSYPSISTLNDGGFVVVWKSDGQDGSTYGVYGKRFAVNGMELAVPASGLNTAVGNEFKINAYTSGSQQGPTVSTLNGGGFVVVWTSDGQDGSAYGVYGKRFAANGMEICRVLTDNCFVPVLTMTSAVSYTENALPVVINNGILVVDDDSLNFPNLNNATVSITGGFNAGQDILGFSNQNGILGAYNNATGILALVGSSSIANYQTALRNVTYINTSDNPSTTSRQVTFVVNDGKFNSNGITSTVTIIPVNDAPYIQTQLTDQSIIPGGTINIVIPTNTFIDPENGVLTYNATQMNNASLPSWIQFTPGSPSIFSGTALNTDNNLGISVYATDSGGLTARMDFTLQTVAPTTQASKQSTSKNGSNNQQSSSYNTLNLLAILLSTGTAVCLLAGGLTGFLVWRRYQARKNDELEMTMRTNHTIVARRFALINKINKDESLALEQQTGIKVTFVEGKKKTKFVLGEGQFGKLRLARDVYTNEFVGVKKIKGKEKIQASEKEASIQKQLDKLPNVMPLLLSLDTLDHESKPVFYQFMPLAGLGNGEVLAKLLHQCNDNSLKDKVMVHVIKSLLTGAMGMHGRHIYHNDIKPNNFVVDIKGNVNIIDFGCSEISEDGMLKGGIGDTGYYPPERLVAHKSQIPFDASKSDAWMLGVTFLEIALNKYPFEDEDANVRIKYWNADYFETHLNKISELTNPADKHYWSLIKNLLNTNPEKRLSIDDALKHPALTNPDYQFTSEEELAKGFKLLQGKTEEVKDLIVTKNDNVEARYPLEKDEVDNNQNVIPTRYPIDTTESNANNPQGFFNSYQKEETNARYPVDKNEVGSDNEIKLSAPVEQNKRFNY